MGFSRPAGAVDGGWLFLVLGVSEEMEGAMGDHLAPQIPPLFETTLAQQQWLTCLAFAPPRETTSFLPCRLAGGGPQLASR